MAEKIQIPDEIKHDLPQTKWGKILGVTPIVMTVIATMLAGLASSEMTKAQYDRSFAAQLQSKAGDQWSYYQAKKLRSAVAHNTLDLLAATSDVQPLEAAALQNANTATVAALTKNQLPEAASAKFDDSVQAALDALDNSKPEAEIVAALNQVKPALLAQSLTAAQDAATAFDNASKPINKASDKFDESLMAGDKNVFRSFSAARLRYTSARYDAESRLNMAVAGIYELQVGQNNYTAEKHHARSGKFFYGMLASQLAVIISTFALAARQRSFLWSIAAVAGTAAVSFSLYVYLGVRPSSGAATSQLRSAQARREPPHPSQLLRPGTAALRNYFTGSVMRIVVPRPGRDKIRICPWCVSTIRPTMARPMPVPLAFVVASTVLKARSCCSLVMPPPVSLKATATCADWSAVVLIMSEPPSGIASAAFRIKFKNACSSCVASPSTSGSSACKSRTSLTPWFASLCRTSKLNSSTRSFTFTGVNFGSVVRAKSRICSTILFRCSILASMICASFERGSFSSNFRFSE